MSQPNATSWTHWAQDAQQNWQDAMTKMSRLPAIWQQATRVRKGVTPSEVIYTEDKLKLLHYVSDTPPKYKVPLVFAFALVNRPYILDLKEGRSVVAHFVNQGFDTYLIDWGKPTAADRHLRLEDYIDGYMTRAVDHICNRTGSDKVSILGYCMGGTMSTMFSALYPEKVQNLILLAAGIDFATREGLLNLWSDANSFDVDGFIDAYGNCPAEFLQNSFLMLKPIQNILEKPISFYERMEDESFVQDFLTMETWLNDNIPVAGETFRQFVKYLYQQNLLTQNKMPLGNRIVNLENITCPVLNLMAQHDDLVPCSQSAPLNDLIGSKDRKAVIFPAGHIGLAMGSSAQRELWPQTCEWLAERSMAKK